MTHLPTDTTDYQLWDNIICRYFEAETTPDEERRLRAFLASPAAANPRFDEVRAVMGFLSVGRRVHATAPVAVRRHHHRPALMRIAAAIAVTFVIGGTLTVSHFYAKGEDCVAYVGGQKVTDVDAVMAEMQRSVQTMERPADMPSVEQQLGSIFGETPLP